MIKIGIDGNEANVEKRVGVSVYALNLLKYFRKTANRETEFNIYLKSRPLNDLPKENKYFKYSLINGKFLWSQIYLPLYLYNQKNIDVYFSPAHYLPRFCPVPQVVTIHDLAYLYYPEDFTKKDLWQLKNWTNFSIKQAKKIIAVSKTTKKDIIKNYQVDENKIQMIYNGFERKNTQLGKKFKLEKRNKPYILYVGTLQPRKNIETLIDAFIKFKAINSNFELVIAGKKGWLYNKIFAKVTDNGLKNDVFFTDYISDNQLIFLYKNAFCLVLPSFYEGFGIPVLEAMNFDCPVVASYSSSLPEIGGDASLYFDPKNPDDLLEKLKSLKENKGLRKELITKGRQRIKDFSWEKCGKETLDIILKTVFEQRQSL